MGAILTYLANKHGWDDLYPTTLSDRARVDEYLHWHHSNVRPITKALFAPKVRPDIVQSEEQIEAGKVASSSGLSAMDSIWLESKPFLTGDTPTLADIAAYGELCQFAPRFGNMVDYPLDYPRISEWMDRMAALPYHDEVHTALDVLGDISTDSTDQIVKRL